MKAAKFTIVLLIVLAFSSTVFAEKVGVIKFYKGNVLVKTSAGSKKWVKPKLNMALDGNYVIKTGKNSEVSIRLKNGSLYKITANKTVNVKTIALKAGKTKNSSALSRLRSLKNKLGRGGKSDMGTPTAVAGVRGADVSKKSKSPINPSELIWEE